MLSPDGSGYGCEPRNFKIHLECTTIPWLVGMNFKQPNNNRSIVCLPLKKYSLHDADTQGLVLAIIFVGGW